MHFHYFALGDKKANLPDAEVQGQLVDAGVKLWDIIGGVLITKA